MKTPYLAYADALDAFLECQEPIKVTKTWREPTMDIFDSPSELFESAIVEADENAEEVEEPAEDGEGAEAAEGEEEAPEGEEQEASAEDEADGDDELADLDDGMGDLDDITGQETDISADEVNAGADEPTSVSAQQLLNELTEGDDNIYTRVIKAMQSKGMTEPTVKDCLPIIALGIKKFMKNKNYASLSKGAMKGLVMNIAKKLADGPDKKPDEPDEGEEATEA